MARTAARPMPRVKEQTGSPATHHGVDRRMITFIGVLCAMFLAALDQTIVSTALPQIVKDLHGGTAISPVVTSYLLTSTAVIAIVGKLSGQVGRKLTVMVGIVSFVVFSAACGAAQNMTQLIIFRGIQGIGGGIIMGTVFVVIADIFSPAERGRYTGLMSAVFGLAAIVGPLVGGYLTQNYSWRWIFYVNLPIGVAVLFLLWFTFPTLRHAVRQTVDYVGAGLLVASAGLVTLGASRAEDHGWDGIVIAMIVAGLAVLVVTPLYEARHKDAIVPPQMFRSSIFSLSSFIAFILGVAMFGSIIYIQVFLQDVVGVKVLNSGVTVWPLMFAMVSMSVVGGIVLSRTGRYAYQTLLGLGLMAFSMYLMSRLNIDSTQFQVAVEMVIFGLGLGLTFPVLNVVSQNAVSQEYVGPAVSAIQFLRQIGATVGTAAMGAVLAQTAKNNGPADFKAALVARHAPAQLLARIPSHVPSGGGSLNAILAQIPDPAVRAQVANLIGGAMADAQKMALAQGIHVVFTISFVLILLSVFVALFIHEIPLRHNAPASARADAGEVVAEPVLA